MKKIICNFLFIITIPFVLSLTGCFNKAKYRLEITQIEGVNIECSKTNANEGETISLSYNNLSEGYQLLYFTVNETQIAGNSFKMPNKNVNISAVISKIQYTITYQIGNDTYFENLEDKITSYTIGTTASLPQVFKENYIFEGWYTDSNYTNQISNIDPSMHENLNLYPKFKENNVDNDGYYLISNATDFINLISNNLSGKFKLTENIDFSNCNYSSIGSLNDPFTGEIDGNNKSISGITINQNSEYVGLFAYINNATIKNLTICNSSIVNPNANSVSNIKYAGILAGFVNNSNLSNISASSININLKVRDGYVGSLFGKTINSTLTKCNVSQSPIKIFSSSAIYAGGICSSINNSTLSKCFVEYDIINVDLECFMPNSKIYWGGIVGQAENSSVIENSFVKQSTSFITAYHSGSNSLAYAGGLIGLLNESKLTNCYALISGINCFDESDDCELLTSGLVGKMVKSIIENSFLTNTNNEESKNISLHCPYKFGFIITDKDADSQISNCFVDSSINLNGGNSNAYDYSLHTITNLNEIISQLLWDQTIWDLADNSLPTLK